MNIADRKAPFGLPALGPGDLVRDAAGGVTDMVVVHIAPNDATTWKVLCRWGGPGRDVFSQWFHAADLAPVLEPATGEGGGL